MASHVSYLYLDELLELIQEVTGLSGDELSTEEVIELAKHALDAPAAERRGGMGGNEVFPTLEEKAAILCERLLIEPPLREEAGKIAYKCMERFLLRNGARWIESPRATVFRFNAVLERPATVAGLRQWIGERIVQAPPLSHPVEQPDLFSQTQQAPAVIMLSEPPRGPSSGQLGEPLRASIQAALDAAAARAYEPCEIRLEHSSLRGAILGEGDEGGSDQEMWEYASRLVVEQVDAMVVVDYLLREGGVDAAFELDLHVAQDGPAIYLHAAKSPPGRYLRGRAAELNLDIAEYSDPAEIGELVGDWVLERWASIRTAARRRRDRERQYRFLSRRLRAAWKAAADEQREVAADAAGMPLPAVNRALTSTGQVTVLAAHRLDALCRALGVATPRAPGRRPKRRPARDDGPDYRTLLEAAKDEDWNRTTIFDLFDRVAEDQRERPYVARSSPPREKDDWVRLRDGLDA